MGYPGNPELSAQAQERVLSAFRQVVSKLQDGQRENALIGLEFVLRLDPTFGPALNLQRQLASGASEIDLSEIMVQMEAPTSEAISTSLVDAVDAFNNRDFMTAKTYAEKVLVEEPGHTEAKQLLAQVQDALKVETQVNYFLGQARQALAAGDAQEASNFVLMAQALDPHHADIARALQEIEASAGSAPLGGFDQGPSASDADGISFQTMDDSMAPSTGPGGPESAELQGFGSEAPGFGSPPEPAAQAAHDGGFGSATFGQEPAGGSLFDAPGAGGGSSPWDTSETPPAPGGADFALPGPPASPPPASDFSSPAGDVADLFQSEPSDPPSPPTMDLPAVPRATDDVATREEQTIQNLLQAGRTALATEDYREAIHHLSRIVLIDAHHHEANTRLAEAREAQAGIDERVEQLLFDAQEAAMGDEQHRLAELVTTISNLDPTCIEAHDLQARLSDAATPPPSPKPAEVPGAPAMPDLDDDLFSEELSIDAPAGDLPASAMDLARPSAPSTSGGRSLPLKKIGMIAAAVVVVIGALAVGMMVFSGGGDSQMEDRTTLVSNLLRQADDLMKQGRGDEALHMLQSFEADGIEKQRIDRRIAAYQKQLAPPTPTPVPESAVEANRLLEAGRWIAAYESVHAGLAEHPDDPGLQELRTQILDVEPRLGSLFSSMRSEDFRTAASIGEEIEAEHPSQTEIGGLIERCLFNAALSEMRTYNLAGAASFLQRFESRNPDDEEVQRILRFVASYKQRPVDMQLRIFVGSLQER
jgi:hypothetical protein